MQTIQFSIQGGPLSVEITAGHAQTGSYDFRLWEAGQNQIVMEKRGDFLNDQDDYYELPNPASSNNGRRAQAIVVIALIPPEDRYSATMAMYQDGKKIGVVSIESTTDQPSVIVNLYAYLSGV